MTQAKRKYVAKQKERNSFSRALHAFDINRIDGEACRAIWKCEAADELYRLIEQAVNQWGAIVADEDAPIAGSDAVEWLVWFIQDAKKAKDKADGVQYRKEEVKP